MTGLLTLIVYRRIEQIMNTVLFDLDGTLLPMDIDLFTGIYFRELGEFFSDFIDPKDLVSFVLTAVGEMINNTGDRSNEDVFTARFGRLIENKGGLVTFQQRFDQFYDSVFIETKSAVFDMPAMRKSVELLKEKGYQLVIATNPIFPMKAIEQRIRWAGFEPSYFSYISYYEKCHYCKPQIKYYEELLSDICKKPGECLMVGNDVQEDVIAGRLGIETYLITDHLLHRTEEEIKADHVGTYMDFYSFVQGLPDQ
jgi:FMN phosphatase YigB (HAD superfamily)